MNILQVGTYDRGGGAAEVSWNLSRRYRAEGHDSYLAVGHRKSDDAHVLQIPDKRARGPWSASFSILESAAENLNGKIPAANRFRDLFRRVADFDRLWDFARGRETFRFPGSHRLLDLPPTKPDLIHCHNIHPDFFDLRYLSELSHQLPVFWTLHDQWAFTGHCGYSLECTRWKNGCGECPDLTLYPAIPRDGTHANWKAKSAIYKKSQLRIATPSQWLCDQVTQSNLKVGALEVRVIPNGIDLTIFKPGDKASARRSLGLPPEEEAFVVLFAGNSTSTSPFKDYPAALAAVRKFACRQRYGAAASSKQIIFVNLGESKRADAFHSTSGLEILTFPYQSDPSVVANYYRAADVYLHAAKAENFPNVILEALAVGTPVVATDVGGIREQVLPYTSGNKNASGILTKRGDTLAMAEAIEALLLDSQLRSTLGKNASADAKQRFDLGAQAARYLSWYSEVLKK